MMMTVGIGVRGLLHLSGRPALNSNSAKATPENEMVAYCQATLRHITMAEPVAGKNGRSLDRCQRQATVTATL